MADPDSGDLLLVAAQDTAAFQRLLSRWKRPVYSVFERTMDPSAATEAAVDVFVTLYQTAGDYGPETAFRVWLFAIVSKRLNEDAEQPVVSIPAQKLTESRAAKTALLRSAVAALPAVDRAAFLLTRIARLPLPAAAQAIGISEPEIRKRLVKAIEFLKVPLDPLLDKTPAAPPTAPGGPAA